MPGAVDNPLKTGNQISDYRFLVPLLGLTFPCFAVLDKALFAANPRLSQIKFIDFLFDQFDFDKKVDDYPTWDVNHREIVRCVIYTAKSGSSRIQLCVTFNNGLSKFELGLITEQGQYDFKWVVSTNSYELPYLETFVEYSNSELGLAYEKVSPYTYKINLERLLEVTNQIIADSC